MVVIWVLSSFSIEQGKNFFVHLYRHFIDIFIDTNDKHCYWLDDLLTVRIWYLWIFPCIVGVFKDWMIFCKLDASRFGSNGSKNFSFGHTTGNYFIGEFRLFAVMVQILLCIQEMIQLHKCSYSCSHSI